jgi:small subunit ribosomal protein S18
MFLTARGKIKPRSQTGLSRRDQRRLGREVKRARELALLPYRIATPGQSGREPRHERRGEQ